MRQFRLSWVLRHRKYVLTGLLLVLVGLLVYLVKPDSSGTNYPSPPRTKDTSNSNYEGFEHDDFIEQEKQFIKRRSLRNSRSKHSAVSPDPKRKEFVENRVRSLKTVLGAVVFKDLLFTPKYPGLWKGYSEKKSDIKKLMSSRLGILSKRDNSSDAQADPDSEFMKSLLGDSRLQDNRSKHKKLDPKTRLQNDALKLLAFQSKLLAKSKDSQEKKEDAAELRGECSVPLCAEYLTTQDAPHFQYCMKKAKIRPGYEPQASTCHFMNGTKRNSVALAGYPLSGHKQVGHLLQQVTGLCTGGTSCDVTLRRNGYPGECLRSGIVLVVKTIQTEPRWTGIRYEKSKSSKRSKSQQNTPLFGSAVYLVRSPLDAMSEVWTKKENPGDWDDFVYSQALEWKKSVLAWVVNTMDHPVLVVRYEDLLENTWRELNRMLDFLQVPYSTSDQTQVELIEAEENESEQPHFSVEQKEYVHSIIHSTMTSLEEAGFSDTCDLSFYVNKS